VKLVLDVAVFLRGEVERGRVRSWFCGFEGRSFSVGGGDCA